MSQEVKIQPRAVEITKKILGGLWWLALIALAMLMINVIGAKMQGRVPEIFGHSVLRIISGSMEDTIPEGSYILVKRVDPEEVRIDDIITFYSSDSAIYGLPNTHRVVEEPIRVGDSIEFVTCGDANNGVKDKVTAKGENLIGVYVTTLDGLTAFATALDKGGMIVLIFALEAVIMAMAVSSFVRARRQKKEEEEKEKMGESKLTPEEIERILGENPEILREFEEKTGISLSPAVAEQGDGERTSSEEAPTV